MRVSIISPYSLSAPGGVQGQVLGLARALRTLGVDARVIGPCDGPPPEPGVTSVGPSVRFASNGSISPMAQAQKTASERTLEALRSFRPDVVHLHEPLVPGPNSAALLGADAAKVGTFHAAGEDGHPAYKALKKVAVSAARQLTIRTAVSADARRMAEEALGGSYIVLPNGVDVDLFAKAEPVPTRRPAVFFLGRHEPRKGLGVLLDAWVGLDRDAVLWVASDGPETRTLRDRRTPNVEWLGRVTDQEKAARLKAATVFCAPALGQESFGIVLLEAMAAGTAVVASDIPGYANVARQGQEALLVPPGDPEALRLALRRILDADALRADLVQAGDLRVAEFSLSRLAERYIPLYETAVAVGTPQ
jgi:phosphatidylinositol alpha-mannosyltransferase